jgi:hypothetical protein
MAGDSGFIPEPENAQDIAWLSHYSNRACTCQLCRPPVRPVRGKPRFRRVEKLPEVIGQYGQVGYKPTTEDT